MPECKACGGKLDREHIQYLEDRIVRYDQELAKLEKEKEELEEEKEQYDIAIANGYCGPYCQDTSEAK